MIALNIILMTGLVVAVLAPLAWVTELHARNGGGSSIS